MQGREETFERRLKAVVTLMVVGTLIAERSMVEHERDDLEFWVTAGVSGHLK